MHRTEEEIYIWKYNLLQYTNNSHHAIIGKSIIEVNPDTSSQIEYHCPSSQYELIYPTQYAHDLEKDIYENSTSIYSPSSVNVELHYVSVDLFLLASILSLWVSISVDLFLLASILSLWVSIFWSNFESFYCAVQSQCWKFVLYTMNTKQFHISTCLKIYFWKYFCLISLVTEFHDKQHLLYSIPSIHEIRGWVVFWHVHSGLDLSSTLLELIKSLSSHSNVLYSHHFYSSSITKITLMISLIMLF